MCCIVLIWANHAQQWMQVVRFLKALACLGVHFYLLQYLPVEVLHSEWYYKLGIPARWASETLCSCVKWKDRTGESMLIVVSYCANYLRLSLQTIFSTCCRLQTHAGHFLSGQS